MRAVHWFRNDLRLEDNAALAVAAVADEIIPLFVLDPYLLAAAPRACRRTNFLLESLRELSRELSARGCPLVVRSGDPAVEVPRLVDEVRADLLTFNRDYSPYARRRDLAVGAAAARAGARVAAHKDRVIFESEEVRTRTGGGFKVYSPFRRAWRTCLDTEPFGPSRRPKLGRGVEGVRSDRLPDLTPVDGETIVRGGAAAAERRLAKFAEEGLATYHARRDLPAADGTSLLSAHLRFGTISIRACVRAALDAESNPRSTEGAREWLAQLVWREFYLALLAEHPRVLSGAFRREYDAVQWNDDPPAFEAWCAGRTGYPFVDAGMRQLVRTGWMHNRARMVVASFLVKDLLLDWRRGEAFFMQHLVDGEPANNNGGWQWSASTGTDAQPYFRVFNPVSQGQRFDPRGEYVRRFVPELRDVADRFVHRPWDAPEPPADYPPPIVDHAERRVAAIARFARAKDE